jgi:DNA-binding transcriptional MerR regulator
VYTIGRLARKFGLSRSTLLYYDSTGLLKPSSRTEGAYRQYSEADAKRLEQICTYRRAGLTLKEISAVLDSPEHTLAQTLEKRLDELNGEIQRLRHQQRFILGLLKNRTLFDRIGVMNVDTWTSLLSSCGFTEKDMVRWHVEFERLAPEKHRQFLEFLCIPDSQIETIRSWASSG